MRPLALPVHALQRPRSGQGGGSCRDRCAGKHRRAQVLRLQSSAADMARGAGMCGWVGEASSGTYRTGTAGSDWGATCSVLRGRRLASRAWQVPDHATGPAAPAPRTSWSRARRWATCCGARGTTTPRWPSSNAPTSRARSSKAWPPRATSRRSPRTGARGGWVLYRRRLTCARMRGEHPSLLQAAARQAAGHCLLRGLLGRMHLQSCPCTCGGARHQHAPLPQ